MRTMGTRAIRKSVFTASIVMVLVAGAFTLQASGGNFAKKQEPNKVQEDVSGSKDGAQSDGLIVHEWGTFTSVAGRDGVAVEWRPLDATSDLPSFVHINEQFKKDAGLRNGYQCVKCKLAALIRMETPVIYFYSDREVNVSARVTFPGGKITEWYPHSRFTWDLGIDWGMFRVRPGAEVQLPVENKPSHYYPARETDSATLQVCGANGQEHEKFLFYRGVGSFQPPVRAVVKAHSVELRTNAPVGRVLLFENQNGRSGYRIADFGGLRTRIERPDLNEGVETLERDLKALLVSTGLFDKEAEAMLNTWRDSWFEEGLRVFYIMPRQVTDSVLPLVIEPTPSKLTRVLVGRIEMVSPEMEGDVAGAAGSSDRERAVRSKYGRLFDVIVKRALETTNDDGVKASLKALRSGS